MKNISSNKNVINEKNTQPQKAQRKGKEERTTQTRKSNEDQNNNSESIMEEVGETPSYSSQEETEVPQEKKRKSVTPPKEDDKNEDQEGNEQDELNWEDIPQGPKEPFQNKVDNFEANQEETTETKDATQEVIDEDCTLTQWDEIILKTCEVVDVPEDGMCGWFSIASASGIIHDEPSKRDPVDKGWTEQAWDELRVGLKEPVVKLVRDAINAFKASNTDPQEFRSAEHALAGFLPGDGKEKTDFAQDCCSILDNNNKSNRPHPEDGWFSNQWGNPAAMALGRVLVVVSISEKQIVTFTLFAPGYVDGYSVSSVEGVPCSAGTTYGSTKSLFEAIENISTNFSCFAPPVYLHYIPRNGGHYQYYKATLAEESTKEPEDAQEQNDEEIETGEQSEEIQENPQAGDEAQEENTDEPADSEALEDENPEEEGESSGQKYDAERIRRHIGISAPGKLLLP